MGLEDIEAWALCNDFEDRGVFHTSDAVINGVQHMAVSSVTACCLNTMASDTVREKSSWTGDTGLTCEQMLYNFGAEQFFAKWMQDLRDSQRPGGSMPCALFHPRGGGTTASLDRTGAIRCMRCPIYGNGRHTSPC
ncbi:MULTISPECIES: family 78 glycoside hydrolase catalytic domain [Bacteria]|uniref:alpha-L-rhamnosidase-related protein n=1 Tax=Bacteria TaxID=2 RepID=UPI000E76CB74|nr:family 78 glycoside hydrolase catalytic domain [Ruthenibacterium lactatiformans]MBN3032176.1 family 78 glycoside hydrolase catalytic domain [Ruthenibacterium lactatiformans]RJW24166.1 hypothetical protein DXC43_17270 [Subdoligranulum sp. TF05-17AC]